MKIQKLLLFSFTLIFLSSCATTYHVTSDYESETIFNNYKSYAYLNHDHNFPLGANLINQQRIERAIEKELGDLGYQKSDEPELLISWFITVETVTRVDYYRDHYNRWQFFTYPSVYKYDEGTLVIDIIDKANRQVIWHGKTSDHVYEGMPNVDKKIKKAVNAIFKQYARDSKWKKREVAMN